MKRPASAPRIRLNAPAIAIGLTVAALLAGSLFVGCAANDPFDPATVLNTKPTVRLFATPIDPEAGLASTSYYDRTFYWSGNDRDGWITEYHVSVRTDADVAEPWIVTDRTDTTMTFETDAEGLAEAQIYLVCRDNRGALSDTLVQLIPLQNFPPVINFEPDFDLRDNLQREIVAEGDTVFWNWGVTSFRLFAFDPDGLSTMDGFYRYTMSDTEPEITRFEGDPLSDPETEWVQADFGASEDGLYKFQLVFDEVAAGEPRTLTISVTDEANADTRFEYDWIVRDPKGDEGSRVLFVREGAVVPEVFERALNETYGEDKWDVFSFWRGFPDRPLTLLENLRKFDLVIWGNNGNASDNLQDVTKAAKGGVLTKYVNGYGEVGPAKLFIFSPTLTGYASKLDATFRANVLGIAGTSLGTVNVGLPVDKLALGLAPHLVDMSAEYIYPSFNAITLDALGSAAQPLYQMEYCRGCYGTGREAPSEPIIGVRAPARSIEEFARVIALGFSPENFYDADDATDQTVAAVRAMLEHELGVAP